MSLCVSRRSRAGPTAKLMISRTSYARGKDLERRLTEDGSILLVVLASLQSLSDRILVLFAPKLDVHAFGQIERPDKEHVHPIDRSDVLDVFYSGTGFDLNDDEQVVVAFQFVSPGRDGKDCMREGGATASGALRGELAGSHDGSSGVLRQVSGRMVSNEMDDHMDGSDLTAVWHIGVMMPDAPESRARLIIQLSSDGILTIGLMPRLVIVLQSCHMEKRSTTSAN
jgi:hypothetical protein